MDECKALCSAEPTCKSFEYGVDHGGTGTAYQPGDCQLQSAATPISSPSTCIYHNLDLYTRTCAGGSSQGSATDPNGGGTATPSPTMLPTPAPGPVVKNLAAKATAGTGNLFFNEDMQQYMGMYVSSATGGIPPGTKVMGSGYQSSGGVTTWKAILNNALTADIDEGTAISFSESSGVRRLGDKDVRRGLGDDTEPPPPCDNGGTCDKVEWAYCTGEPNYKDGLVFHHEMVLNVEMKLDSRRRRLGGIGKDDAIESCFDMWKGQTGYFAFGAKGCPTQTVG